MLETMIRLSVAHAKARLSSEVSGEDVEVRKRRRSMKVKGEMKDQKRGRR